MEFKRKKLSTSTTLAVITALMLSANARAEVVVEHSGSFYSGAEHNSNLLFLEDDEDSVNLYTLIPEYKLTALDGKNEWTGLVGLLVQRSSDSSISEAREDPYVTLGWTRALENGSFGLAADYSKQSTRETQFLETGVVADDATSVSRAIKADWQRALSERFDLNVGAAYEKTTISDSDTAQLVDNDVRKLSAGLAYKLNEKVKPFVRISATDYRAIDRVEYQKFYSGAQVQYTPRLNFEAGAGVLHVSTTGENDAVGFVTMAYTGERSQFDLAISRDAETTDVNQIIINDRFDLGYAYDLTEKSRTGLNLGLGQTDSGQDNQEIFGYYERDFSDTWLMRISMELANIKNEGGDSAKNNIVGISFTYNSLKF